MGLNFCFMFYFSFTASVLFYRCSQVLSNYNNVLKIELNKKSNQNLKLLNIFFDITKVVQNLSEHIKNVSLFIVFYGLHGIFLTLLLISSKKFHFSDYEYSITQIYFFSCNIIIIAMYTISSSLISENMMKIKRTVKEFINRYFCKRPDTEEYLFYLKRIENEEIVHISVCGLFYLTRGFLLTALSAILTYGLLLVNLNL